jgi:hypothetical protein
MVVNRAWDNLFKVKVGSLESNMDLAGATEPV